MAQPSLAIRRIHPAQRNIFHAQVGIGSGNALQILQAPTWFRGEKLEKFPFKFQGALNIGRGANPRGKGQPCRQGRFHNPRIHARGHPEGGSRIHHFLDLIGGQNRPDARQHSRHPGCDLLQCPNRRGCPQGQFHGIHAPRQQSLRQRHPILHPIQNQHRDDGALLQFLKNGRFLFTHKFRL